MLARMVLLNMFFYLCTAVVAERNPNVILILADENLSAEPQQTAHAVLDEACQKEASWQTSHGDCRISPSRAATFSAVIYGKESLLTGVVTDADWRRRPVSGVSLMDRFRKTGYQTSVCGTGQLMNTLNDPWRDSSGKEDGHLKTRMNLGLDFSGDKPFFSVLRMGGSLNDGVLAETMQKEIIPNIKASKRSTVILILRIKERGVLGVRGVSPGKHHYPARWFLYVHGEVKSLKRVSQSMQTARTDWEIHAGLLNLLEPVTRQKSEHRVFHKANWLSTESPDKYRHRGSLVVGKGFALVDGLELYPATKNLEPDLSKPLDIAQNKKLHAELLTAHAEWWKRARMALHDPRAFLVGEVDGKVTRLTAMDWRASKIMHEDGTRPVSKPMIHQAELLATLKALRDKKYRESFPSYSGSWAVKILQPGRYQIAARLLPAEEKSHGELQGGRAFFKLGRSKVELRLLKGGRVVTVTLDADAGVTDLECWFTGQLSLKRELGAFFIEIQRVGEKKFNFKPRGQ